MIKINKMYDGLRLDKYLFSLYPDVINGDIYKFIKNKDITINNKKVKNSYILKENDLIVFTNFAERILNNPKNKKEHDTNTVDGKYIELFNSSIIYEDDNILAINKPYNLSVQGGNGINTSISNIISYINLNEHKSLKLVHRIDKTTTGILIIAKNLASANELMKLFKDKNNIKKYYYALTIGNFSNKNGTIDIPLTKEKDSDFVFKDEKNGKKAITYYRVIKYINNLDVSFVKLQILTGRTHQIRVHLKEIGHPILGDFKYNKFKNNYISSNKLQLHSSEIEFKLFGKKIYIKSEIPHDMKKIIESAE